MRITFFIGGLSGGGAERVVCQLATYLSDRHEVKILTVSESKIAYPLDRRVTVTSLERPYRNNNALARTVIKLKDLRRYIKHNESDIYVVFLTYCIAAMALNRRIIKVPIVSSSRNDPSLYPNYLKTVLMWATKRMDGVVNQTIEIDNFFKTHTKMKSSKVIPNAISNEFKPYNGLRDKRIVTVGRFNKQKNIPLLIKSFYEFSKDYSDYSLEIYGDGALKEDYVQLTNSLGLSNKVFFPGYVNDVAERIKNAAMFILPSDYEGISNALMEALALGMPCISTDSKGGGSRMLIKNGINGLLVPCNDIDRMVAAMRTFSENPDLANECGKNATSISALLAPSEIYKQWEDYITSFMKE